MPWKLVHHRDVTCPRWFLSQSAVPCWGLNREFPCLQMFSLFHFHRETCEMLSIPVTCFAAVLAAGQAQAGEERPRAGARFGVAPGRGQGWFCGTATGEGQGSSGPGAEARGEPLSERMAAGEALEHAQGKRERGQTRGSSETRGIFAEELVSWMQHMVI